MSIKALPILIIAMFAWVLAVSGVQSHADSITSVEQTATAQLGKPYVYGASGTKAFDCSGFTQYIYKQHWVSLLRTAQDQFNSNKRVRAKHARRGDLVFFGKNTKSIYHVGLYLGNGKMIDAQNRGVVIEKVHAPWWHLVGYARPTNWI